VGLAGRGEKARFIAQTLQAGLLLLDTSREFGQADFGISELCPLHLSGAFLGSELFLNSFVFRLCLLPSIFFTLRMSNPITAIAYGIKWSIASVGCAAVYAATMIPFVWKTRNIGVGLFEEKDRSSRKLTNCDKAHPTS
jgi:hypothetical protein